MLQSAKEKLSNECDTSEDESSSSGDEDSSSESSDVHTDIETEDIETEVLEAWRQGQERMLREGQELRQFCEDHYILILPTETEDEPEE